MKNLNVNVIAEISIFAAIGWLLDFVQGAYSDFLPFLANGGSIGISMLVVFVIAFRRGILPAVFCGLIMGLLDMADGLEPISDAWYKVFAQVALDYGIGYSLCALAGLFYKSIRKEQSNSKTMMFIVLGCYVGAFGKFFAHFLSGILFWPSTDWGGPITFSILYNSLYMLPSFILCSITACIIWKKNKKILLGDTSINEVIEEVINE